MSLVYSIQGNGWLPGEPALIGFPVQSEVLTGCGSFPHSFIFRGCHTDATGKQRFNRFGVDFNSGKKSGLDSYTTAVPEFAVTVNQPVVGWRDIDIDQNFLRRW